MRILLGVALAASVILNVVLLVRGRGAEATPSSALPSSGANPGFASEHGAGAAPAAAPDDRPAHATHTTLADCEHALFDAERRLATTRARLWTSLPMPEKFEAAEPNPAVEAPLRSELARLFAAKDLEGAAWTLECRGTICQLQIVSTDDQKASWMERLQADEALRKRSRGMSFHAGRPTNDQASGLPVIESDVYLDVAEAGDDQQAGLAYLGKVWQAFVASSATADCSAMLEGRAGSLDIRLDVNQGGAGVHAHVGGELGTTAAGRCIADRLRAHAEAAAPAAGTPPSVHYFVLELPLRRR